MTSPLSQFWAECLYQWGKIHRYFGVTHGVTREFARAEYYFGRAFALNPQHQQARLDRAIMLGRELGQPKQALQELDELATSFTAKHLEVILNRAQLRQEVGDYAGALSDWENYLKTADQDDSYRPLAQITAEHLKELLQDNNLS